MDKEEIKEELEKASEDIDIKRDLNGLENNAEEEFYNNIKGYVEIEKFRNIRNYLDIVLNNNIFNGLIIEGETGIGKSTIIKSILKEKKRKFIYLNSYSTPLAFYKEVYRNRNSIILLDDLEGLYKDVKGISILRALLNTDMVRFIRYETTSSKLDVPNKFIFKGKIIILANNIRDKLNNATINRTIHRSISLTFQEKIDLMEKIIRFNYPELIDEKVKQIIEFIKKNADETIKNFTFRTIEKIVEYHLHTKYWKELAFEELERDEDLVLIKKTIEDNKIVINQVRYFIDETGKSRATFFRLKKKLQKSLKVSKSQESQDEKDYIG